MAETVTTPPAVRLRIALEDLNPEGDPDHFCELIAAALASSGDPYVVLCQAVWGHYTGGEMTLFENWASGLQAPAPIMRRKVIRVIRDSFRDGELLPRTKERE